MVNIQARELDIESVTSVARQWADGFTVPDAKLNQWFEDNGLVNASTVDPPFDSNPIAGKRKWVAIEPSPPDEIHFYFGHVLGRNGVGDFRALTKKLKAQVPLLRSKSQKWWRVWDLPEAHAEVLIERTETGIHLVPPPGFVNLLLSSETLSAAAALLLAFSVGFNRQAMGLGPALSHGAVSVLIPLLAYVALRYLTTRRKWNWSISD